MGTATASSIAPVILLVPGAFCTPSSFDDLLPHLAKAGLETRPGAYPSCDPPDPDAASCRGDISALRENILGPLVEDEHRDVVVLAHSYGGVVGGAAAKGLDKPTRAAQGLPGGVIGLVYLAGNITLEGESLREAVGGKYPSFIKENMPSDGLALIEPVMDVLYNDCDQALKPKLEAAMKPHALAAFQTNPGAPAWADDAFDGRRAYVRTVDDCCNPPVLQDIWLQKTKKEWAVVNLQTGHMPFISQPEALAAQIIKFTNDFTAL